MSIPRKTGVGTHAQEKTNTFSHVAWEQAYLRQVKDWDLAWLRAPSCINHKRFFFSIIVYAEQRIHN